MKIKFAVAAAAACLVVTACGVAPTLKGTSQSGQMADPLAAQNSAARYQLMTEEPPCPTCCVAITGTSHFDFTVNGQTFTMNFEINTASGRINAVDIGPVGETATKYPITIPPECIIDTNGDLVGAIVRIEGATFTLDGERQGGNPNEPGTHAQANTISGTITGTGFPFSSFGPADISTGQNLFIDNGCDGTPN